MSSFPFFPGSILPAGQTVYDHDAIRKEIRAIELALGVNLATALSLFLASVPAGAQQPPDIGNGPDIIPASPTVYDDEFTAGSLDAKWTQFNATGLTTAFLKDRIILKNTSTGGVPSGIYQVAPSPTWEFTAKCHIACLPAAYELGGIAAIESATNKVGWVGFYISGGTLIALNTARGNNSGVNTQITSFTASFNGAVYLRIKYDGTNVIYSVSSDGVAWVQVTSEAKTASFTTAPDRIALMVAPYVASAFSFDWFRRTA